MKIYLASRSPRRIQLLEQLGVQFSCLDIDIDEHWDGQEEIKQHVIRLSREKARAGFNQLQVQKNFRVIGADTCVVLDQEILGKATSHEDAKRMLKKLSGQTHDVYSAVTVMDNKGSTESLLNASKVKFKLLTQDEINEYCASGEPVGKAGGYAIQGRAAAFIPKLSGSYSGVMGLPLYELMQLLGK